MISCSTLMMCMSSMLRIKLKKVCGRRNALWIWIGRAFAEDIALKPHCPRPKPFRVLQNSTEAEEQKSALGSQTSCEDEGAEGKGIHNRFYYETWNTQTWICDDMCRSTRARWELAATYVATLQHNVFSMHPTCISGIGWRMLTSIQRIHSQSPDFYNKESSATAPKATDIMVTHGFTGTLNMSQQIDRMGVSELRAPCVTPKAFLWNFCEKRPFTGIDKLMFQCFPVDNMKLTCLDEPVASQHVVA